MNPASRRGSEADFILLTDNVISTYDRRAFGGHTEVLARQERCLDSSPRACPFSTVAHIYEADVTNSSP